MKNFADKIKLVYESEYKMKNWKSVSIYPKILEDKRLSEFSKEEKMHLTRVGFRWYVYFYFRNPDTDKFERFNAPTLGINRDYKDFDERFNAIQALKRSVKASLKNGASPHSYSAIHSKQMTVGEAIDYAMGNKKVTLSKRSFDAYSSKINIFKDYLDKRGVLNKSIDNFNHQYIREHLIEVSRNTSASNSNTTLAMIKSIFTELYQSDIIKENYTSRLRREKVVIKKRKYKAYTIEQAEFILKYLEDVHPVLRLYIKFIMYNFLRIVEIARLKVKDIDLEDKTLQVFTKQGRVKKKRLPDSIVNILKDYDLSNKEAYLFARDEIGKDWDKSVSTRSKYYGDNFDRLKPSMGYKTGDGYTLYSFRHSGITIGYQNLRKRLSKDDALDELMKYTGHETRSSLARYIQDNDIELVDEYEGIIK